MPQDHDGKCRFGVIGVGARAAYYANIARLLPDRFELSGAVARNAGRGQTFGGSWRIPVFATVEEMVEKISPEFVLTAVSWQNNHAVTRKLVDLGVPVLAETPPAAELADLLELYEHVARVDGRVQVAEQMALRPLHQAQLAVVREGWLGRVSQAQVSVAHGYHGISLMRRFLGVQFENCSISAKQLRAPLLHAGAKGGDPELGEIRESLQQFFWFEFGDRWGLIDFSPDQYWSWIRNERTLVRGERGEIIDRTVHCLKDPQTPLRMDLCEHRPRHTSFWEGHYLKSIQAGEEWVYQNPFPRAPLADDEIAVATILLGMARYVRTGEHIYSLAEASQDHYLNLMAQKALAQDTPVQTETMPWAS